MVIFLIIFNLIIINSVYADRVCIRKSDGFPIEYQTGDAPLGILTKNAVQSGYNENDVEEKYINPRDYAQLHYEKIDKPIQDKKEEKKKQARDKIKQKLNFTEKELQELEEAIK